MQGLRYLVIEHVLLSFGANQTLWIHSLCILQLLVAIEELSWNERKARNRLVPCGELALTAQVIEEVVKNRLLLRLVLTNVC